MFTVRELTPHAAGAVCVLQLEGERAFEATKELTGRKQLAAGELFATMLRVDEEPLDEALVVIRSALQVELHLHGSPPLVDQMLELLCERFGATRFVAAETLEARASERVANAPCVDAARILLDQANGALRAELERIAGLDGAESRDALTELHARGERAKFVLRPARVVLAGPVNAGKSTLFNLLVGERRALTSDLEGTTRDLVHARASLGSWPVEWIDTAGERGLAGADAEEAIELEGQHLAQRAIEESDLCFWLAPNDSEPALRASELDAVVLRTFGDRSGNANAICVPRDPQRAVRAVQARFEEALGLTQPLWSAGAAVPFEPAQLMALESWLTLEPPARAAAIRAWLADS